MGTVLLLLALGFAALAAARIAWAPPRPRWVLPAVVGVVVLAVAYRYGPTGFLLAAAAAGAAWFASGRRAAGPALGVDEARALLGLGPTATADDVRAAHRRRIAAAHPDRGGDPMLAARLNAARDTLLRELGR